MRLRSSGALSPVFGAVLGAIVVAGFIAWAFWYGLRTVPAAPPAEALANGRDLLKHRRVLVIAAHPDDVEWYGGGTLILLANRGAQAHVIVASDGEKGPNRIGAADLRRQRRQEQKQAARVNGYTRLYMLHLPDRGVARGNKLAAHVAAIWKQVRPDAVVTFDPALPALPYLHADHQGAGRVALDYWTSLGDKAPPLYLWDTSRPNTVVDISGVIETKVLGLAAHRTQNLGSGAEYVKRRDRRRGEMAGVPYAEAFRRLRP